MKKQATLVTIVTIALVTGCAGPAISIASNGYSAVNTGAAIATDKGLTDRAVSVVADADCNLWNVFKGLFYCEVRDPAKTYNRNGL